MELRQIEMFVETADRRSITAAAQALFVAQPSVSAQMAALERELGTALFDRLPRGVRLTEAGRAVLPHARQILRQVAEIRDTIDALEGLQHGRVIIGTMPTMTTHIIPTVIKVFRERFPGIDLRVVESSASGILEELAAHRLDLAVVTNAEGSPQIVAEPLMAEELYAIVPVDDPLAEREEIDLCELKDRPFVVLESGFSLRSTLWEVCSRAGFSPRIAQEMSSIQGIKGLVEIGLGVSIAPRTSVEQEEQLGLLRALRLRQRPERELEIVTSRGMHLSRAATEFIAICRQVAGDLARA